MPTLFLNRPRHHGFSDSYSGAAASFFWERASAILYEIGGILIAVGGLWVFPPTTPSEEVPGLWIKMVGTSCYLAVNIFAAKEIRMYNRQKNIVNLFRGQRAEEEYVNLEFISTYLYLTGSASFLIGTAALLPQFTATAFSGAIYIVGSLAFVIGACLNAMQIVTQETMLELQLTNMTAISFIVGSTLFASGSVPCLWTNVSSEDHEIKAFMAWSYLIGSILFVCGGFTSFWKASIVAQKEIERDENGTLQSSALAPLKFRKSDSYASCDQQPVKEGGDKPQDPPSP